MHGEVHHGSHTARASVPRDNKSALSNMISDFFMLVDGVGSARAARAARAEHVERTERGTRCGFMKTLSVNVA